jgi:hypothetical protein
MKTRHLDKDWEQEFAGVVYMDTAHNKNASSILDRREAERVPLHSHVTYSSNAETCLCREEGKPKKGCRIVGPVLAVGSTMAISLDLGDGKTPT